MDLRAFRDKIGVIMKILIGVIVGSAVGLAVGYFGRCSTGTCPLTSNPWISTIVGAFMGLIITMS